MRSHCRILAVIIAAIGLLSCSTTRVLQDNEYRLAKNNIKVTNNKHFNTEQLQPYLKQKPNAYFIFGWNPFLNVYNWQNGKGKTWDKLIQKVGVAPVVYDAELVESSIANLENRLKYLGYFDSHVDSRVSVKRKKVNVTYDITLGKQFPIKSIEIELPDNEEFAQEFLADTASMTVKAGDYLSEASLEAETERFSSIMRNQAGCVSYTDTYTITFNEKVKSTSAPGWKDENRDTADWKNPDIDIIPQKNGNSIFRKQKNRKIGG